MNTATHTVEVPFPQAFTGLAPRLFPSAPRYRPVVDKRDIRPLGGNSASVSRDYTPVSLIGSLVHTLVLLPVGTIYDGTAETLFSCQSTRSSVPGLSRLWLNIQQLSSFSLPVGSRPFISCLKAGAFWPVLCNFRLGQLRHL
jgi:hypothetical protein